MRYAPWCFFVKVTLYSVDVYGKTGDCQFSYTGVRTVTVPRTWEPLSPSTDINGVKRDPDKKHLCIPYYLTQSSMRVRTLNLWDFVFLYTGAIGNWGSVWLNVPPQIQTNRMSRNKKPDLDEGWLMGLTCILCTMSWIGTRTFLH